MGGAGARVDWTPTVTAVTGEANARGSCSRPCAGLVAGLVTVVRGATRDKTGGRER